MFKKPKVAEKVKILLVDEHNDLQSQVAEYFINEMYGDLYEVQSAGPNFDCIDCELVSVMYQIGYDIRPCRAKDFREKKIPAKLDYIIFLEKATYVCRSSCRNPEAIRRRWRSCATWSAAS